MRTTTTTTTGGAASVRATGGNTVDVICGGEALWKPPSWQNWDILIFLAASRLVYHAKQTSPHHLHITPHHSTPLHDTKHCLTFLQGRPGDILKCLLLFLWLLGVIPPSGCLKQMLSLCRLTLVRIFVIKSSEVKPIQLKEIKESWHVLLEFFEN